MENDETSFDLQKFLRKYLRPLLMRKWWAIIPAIIFSVGATIYALSLPNIYESNCVLTVKRSRIIDDVLSERGARLDVRKVLQAVREKMLGWGSVIKVIKEIGLDKTMLESDSDTGNLEKLYRLILKKTNFRTKGEDMIQVSYIGTKPETNFRIVDGLVSNFMEQSLIGSRSEADATLSFIEQDLERLKRNLDKAERKFRAFEEEHIEELPGSENSILPKLYAARSELEEINREIGGLTEKIKFLEEHKKGESETVTGEVVKVPNPKLEDLNQQVNNLEIEITMLRAKYFDEHPTIVQKQKELITLNEMLEKETEKIISEETIISNPRFESMIEQEFSMRLELKALESRKNKVEGMIASLAPTLENIPALKQKLFELESDYNVNKRLYEERLVQKSKAVLVKEMSRDERSNPFQIIEPARISFKPIKKEKLKIMAGGVILGIGLGLGLVFGLEKLDERFKTTDEIQEYLNIPILGTIPTILTKADINKG